MVREVSRPFRCKSFAPDSGTVDIYDFFSFCERELIKRGMLSVHIRNGERDARGIRGRTEFPPFIIVFSDICCWSNYESLFPVSGKRGRLFSGCGNGLLCMLGGGI